MKKIYASLKMLLIAVFLVGGTSIAWAETYTHTFASGQFGTSSSINNAPVLSDVAWTFEPIFTKAGYLGWDAGKGLQMGSSGNPISTATLSTTGIVGAISSVKVNTSGASSVAATIAVFVGEALAGEYSLTATATEYTFDLPIPASGQVQIVWSNTSAKAVYVKSIEINYTQSTDPTVIISGIENDAIDFGSIEIGESPVTKIFYVSGINLTNDIDLTIPAADTLFRVSPASITPVDGTVPSTEVTVTYLPGSEAATNASTLTVASGSFSSPISLSGETTAPAAHVYIDGVEDNNAVALDFGAAKIGGSTVDKTFTIEGVNLTGNITLALSGTDAAQFGLSTETLTPEDGAVAETTITVTYTPGIAEATHTASVDITAETGTYTVSLSAKTLDVTGAGTYEDPFTLEDVINLASSDKGPYWVKGYIAGVVVSGGPDWNIATEASASQNTNIALSNNPLSMRAEQVYIAIQLPIGAVRDGLNLYDNPANLGKEVLVKGNLENYFSTNPGVRSTTEYEILNTTGVETNTQNEGVVVYAEGINIVIKSDVASNVYVYSVSGKLIYNQAMNGNNTTIALDKGVYIVKVGNKAYKVVL